MAAWQNDPLVGDASGAKPWESDPTEASDGPGASAVIPLAARQNPDAAAKASRMSRETGISFDTALRNSPELELRLNTQRAAEAAAKTVTLSRYMADYEFAAKAHDEAERLGAVERTVRGLGGGLLSPLEPTLRGAGEVLGMVQRRGIQGIADLVLPEPMAGGKPTPDSLTGPSVAEGWRAAAAGVGEFSREVTGIDPRAATFYDNVLSGLGQLPTQIALSLATGGTSNFAQGVGIMADKTDKDPNKATGAGDLALLLGGAITMVTEKITERVIPKGLMDGKALDMSRAATAGRIAIAGGTEFTQEFTENLLHDVTRKALVNPDAPIQIEQSLEEGGVGGVVGAVARTVVESALRIRARNVRANTAEDDATRLQQLMSAVGQLRLLERDRASVADFVQAAAADSDNAPTHLYMDGRTLGEVLDQGGISVDQLKEMLPAVASQLEAVGTNSPVAIPVGELMAALPGTNLEQVFLQNLRSTPEGLSQLEATAAREQTEQLLNQEITRIGGQLAQTQQFMAERDEIQTILADEITRTGNGGLTQTDAQKSATLVAAGMASVAARLRTSGDARFENITPMGLFNMYRMRVADSVVGAQDTLSSTNTKLGQLDNVEAFHFSKAERRVISTAMFGTGLKGSNQETYATAQDARLRKRAYFYVDKGTGINPEAGVGGIGHKASLSNIYDGDSDPLRLKGRGGQLDFESRVLDAGFSGYLTRMEGGQSGQVILLGDQTVQPEVLGPTGKTQGAVVPAAKPRESRGRDIVTDALKARTDLPAGALSPQRWAEVLGKLMPETAAALQEAGVLEGTGSMYKSDLIKAYEAATPEPVYAQPVSTRVPTAVKALENPLEDMLVIGLDAAKADPKAFAKNVELLRGYLNFRDNKSASTPEKAAEQFISHAVDNLLWLFDQVPAETRVRSKLWYDGARAIAEQWAAKYGITEAQAAGMLAVLSPQKDWYQNVSLAERVLDVMSSKQDFAWTAEMDATMASLPAISETDAAAIRGKTLAQLDSDYLQAIWVRVYDQTYHERGYRIISPEGQFTEWATNLDGESRSKTAWGSFTEIGKAISVFKNGDIANISDALGGQHKVRNFYNNIFNPASAHGDVTIDTHAVAAALLRPLSGSADEVLHNFGSGGAANSSIFGAKGTYGIYAEAYRRAAEQRGVLPREMQSITWEAVRGLYTAKFKAQNANVAAIDAIWAKYKKRKASLDDTRTQLLALAGGVNPPTWEQRPGAPASETPWASSYTQELRASSGADGAAGGGARSAGVLAQSGGVNGRDQQAGNGSGRDQGGSLAPLEGAPNVAGAAGPDPRLVAVAEQYARSIGIDLTRQAEYVTVDPERAAKIAAAYDAMAHAPQDSAVKEAYQNLIAQTLAQYRALEAAGYKFFLVDETTDPYAGNPWNAMRDLRANQRMGVFATEAGFGSGGQLNIGLADPAGGANLDPATVLAALQEVGAVAQASEVFTSDTEPTLVVKVKQALTKEQGDRLSTMLGQEAIAQRTDDESGALFGPAADKWGDFNPEFFITIDGTRASEVANPLLADTGLLWPYGSVDGPMKRVLANDLFRAVHDAFGHGLEGSGFRAQGEENAWQAHVRLFTGSAVGAITSETRGQNSWLNYGPYGERNQTAKVEDTVFAEQKTGLMPEWTWTEGRVSDEGLTEREQAIRAEGRAGRPSGVLNQSGGTIEVDGVARPRTNSDGQAIAETDEELINFWRWFRDSKVVDSSGRPIPVYHGAKNAGFDRFDTDGQGKTRGTGAWFTTDSSHARSYSGRRAQDVSRLTGADIVRAGGTDDGNVTVDPVEGVEVEVQVSSKGDKEWRFFESEEAAREELGYEPSDDMPFRPLSGVRVVNYISGYEDTFVGSGQEAAAWIDESNVLDAMDAPGVYSVYLSLQDPVEFDWEGNNWNSGPGGDRWLVYDTNDELVGDYDTEEEAQAALADMGGEGEIQQMPGEGPTTDDAARDARDMGGDGVEFTNISDPGPFGGGEGLNTVYVAFNPEQVKAVRGNRGTFDPKNEDIFRQGPRGQFQPSTNVVALLANANKSTFLHESGHFYLEMMADLASMPNPPQFIVDDMAKVFKWFGVKDLAGWQALPFEKKRPLHEKFAEGFEQYLFEGRAPSVELRSVFASFASWLKDIYRTVRDFAKASGNGLNDEVRGVFDRLLAADEEISRVRELETFEAIFKSAEQAGMTPEEWQAYKAQQQAAIDKAMELMQPRVLRDMQWAIGAHNRALAKIRREMAAKRKEIREQVEQEVDALPQFAAGKALADGQAEFELDPTAADFNAAALADAYGFPSIDAMYSAVEAAAGTRDSVADALTDQRMLEQEGLLATAKGMETAAAEAVMNEAQAKFVATELLALERAGKQNEKTATGGTVNVLDRAARDFAKELVGRRGLAEIDPARFPVPGSRRAAAASMFRAAANRAGALANKALAGGDTAAAAQAKRDQTLNTYAAVEAQKARDEMNGIFEFFGRVTRGNEQKLVDKGRDPDIVNAARAVLAAFGVSPRTEKSAREYLDAVKAYDPGLYAVIEPSITAAEQQAKPANQLTMAELRDLRDEVKALWDLAKRSRQMEVEGNMLDLADAELQLQQRLEDIGIPDTLPGDDGRREGVAQAAVLPGRRHPNGVLGRAHGRPFRRAVRSAGVRPGQGRGQQVPQGQGRPHRAVRQAARWHQTVHDGKVCRGP